MNLLNRIFASLHRPGRSVLGLSVVALFLAGCATPQKNRWVRTGDPLIDGQTAIAQGNPEDRVLWQCKTAAVAMRKGEFELAKRLLDDAILSVGGIAVGDNSAKKARGYFREESTKTFRGEPYEQVMVYYYRGILYWMDGEVDNARACFRNAQFIDGDATGNEYRSDYVLLDYLEGLATETLHGDGGDSLRRAKAAARLDVPPDYQDVNVLFFIELGQGPTKYAAGEHRQELRFRPGQSNSRGAIIRVNGKSARVGVYDDLSFQATTRGGRVMDHILANKAVFKSTTDEVGNAAMIGGMVVAGSSRRNQEVGLGLVAAGLVSKIISAATTPAADTRAWDNLPQYLTFAALALPPGQHSGTVEFLDRSGRSTGRIKNVTVSAPASGEDAVVFVSDRT